MKNPLIEDLIRLAIAEDLSFGDLTSALTIPEDLTCSAEIIAREPVIVCGTFIVNEIIDLVGASVKVEVKIKDGDRAPGKTCILRLSGLARDILSIERTVLNFLQRLCGIASHVNACVTGVPEICFLDTRKTTPGWRSLEKYAVRVGGAKNHRFSLSDMILIKDNHVRLSGGKIFELLAKVQKEKPLYCPVEIEVQSLAELNEALRAKAGVIMLDNLGDEDLKIALATVSSLREHYRPIIEVSGGITQARAKQLGSLGVQFVSMSSLITGARSADLALEVIS